MYTYNKNERTSDEGTVNAEENRRPGNGRPGPQRPGPQRPPSLRPQPIRPEPPRPRPQAPGYRPPGARPQRPEPPRPGPPRPQPGFFPDRGAMRPMGAPPQIIPARSSVLRVDRGAIDGCMFSFTYVWLRNGREFWFFPVYLGRTSIAGFRWQQGRWSYIGFDLDSVEFFSCGGY